MNETSRARCKACLSRSRCAKRFPCHRLSAVRMHANAFKSTVIFQSNTKPLMVLRVQRERMALLAKAIPRLLRSSPFSPSIGLPRLDNIYAQAA